MSAASVRSMLRIVMTTQKVKIAEGRGKPV